MAPEIKQGAQRPNAAMDIFAIGVLLQQLRERPAKPIYAMGPEDLQDMLDVLAFHCLSEDVNLRFRSMQQLGCFVEHYVCHDAGYAPRTIDIPGGPVSSDRGDAMVRGFKLGIYPVTNYQYQQFWISTGHRAPHISANYRLHGPWCPVIGVDLTDAQAYCQWLTGNSSVRWRIPTEAEWLRAATLDDARAYPWGDDDALVPCDATGNSAGTNGSTEPRANFGEYFRGPTPVGAFEAGKSAAGCYDMGGNVWEWCTDHLGNGLPFRVIKGGAYDFGKESLHVRARNRALVGKRSGHLGFRVLCEGAD
jgi:formylglycine-generating enzyme required for sulfatase activity